MDSTIYETRKTVVFLKLLNFSEDQYQEGVKAFEEQLKKELGRITSVKWLGNLHKVEVTWSSSVADERKDVTKTDIERIAKTMGQ